MKVEYIPRRALYQKYAAKTSFDQKNGHFKVRKVNGNYNKNKRRN